MTLRLRCVEELRRRIDAETDVWKRVGMAAGYRCAEPVASESQVMKVLDEILPSLSSADADANPDDAPRGRGDIFALLELTWRSGRMHELPCWIILRILEEDRTNTANPYVHINVLRELLRAAARAVDENRIPHETLMALSSHLRFRALLSDSVRIPITRAPSAEMAGLYVRSSTMSEGFVEFEKIGRAPGEAILRVPTRRSEFFGEAEPRTRTQRLTETTLLRASGGVIKTFRSQESFELPDRHHVWIARRTPLPFPDYDGQDLNHGEAVECCSIFEEHLTFLPSDFEYSACVSSRSARLSLETAERAAFALLLFSRRRAAPELPADLVRRAFAEGLVPRPSRAEITFEATIFAFHGTQVEAVPIPNESDIESELDEDRAVKRRRGPDRSSGRVG
jgi:hypothetical protein